MPASVAEMQSAQVISQVFLGTNLKCASCHDSFINQWKLDEAYGLANVFADAAAGGQPLRQAHRPARLHVLPVPEPRDDRCSRRRRTNA